MDGLWSYEFDVRSPSDSTVPPSDSQVLPSRSSPFAPRSPTVRSTPRALVRALTLSALFAALYVPRTHAQSVKQTGAADPMTKRAMTIEDYARWRTINGAQLS